MNNEEKEMIESTIEFLEKQKHSENGFTFWLIKKWLKEYIDCRKQLAEVTKLKDEYKRALEKRD